MTLYTIAILTLIVAVIFLYCYRLIDKRDPQVKVERMPELSDYNHSKKMYQSDWRLK